MKQNNKKFNNAMHKFVGVLDKYGNLTKKLQNFKCRTLARTPTPPPSKH